MELGEEKPATPVSKAPKKNWGVENGKRREWKSLSRVLHVLRVPDDHLLDILRQRSVISDQSR